MTPQKIWIEQCEAARTIEDEFGTDKALAYLIGEKFLNFLEAADRHSAADLLVLERAKEWLLEDGDTRSESEIRQSPTHQFLNNC